MRLHALRFAVLSLVASSTILLGCSDDGLAPDVTGLVDAWVNDNPEVTQAARTSGSAAVSAAKSFTGTAAGNMSVAIRSTGGTWVELGSPNGITVPLQQTVGVSVHGTQSALSGSYDRVRLTIGSGIEVKVDAGSEIGQTTLQSDASATVATDDDVVIEITVAAFTVSETGTVTVAFELNSEQWLDTASLDAGVVADPAVSAAVTAAVTGG